LRSDPEAVTISAMGIGCIFYGGTIVK
jgi:hypothetical protein